MHWLRRRPPRRRTTPPNCFRPPTTATLTERRPDFVLFVCFCRRFVGALCGFKGTNAILSVEYFCCDQPNPILQEHGLFEQADQEADERRAREIANDIAKRKLEQVLIVEKLQELRSIRIQKLKKQGHFLPEEDDKFLERVQAAVEEEERQAIAAADTDAARDAIATAEESRKPLQSHGPDSKVLSSDKGSNDTEFVITIVCDNNCL